MNRLWSIIHVGFFAGLLATRAFAGADTPADAAVISCGNGVPGGVSCTATKDDLKEARSAYAHGLKLQNHQRIEEAFAQFDEASRLVPQDGKFLSAREFTKAALVFQHTSRGDAFSEAGQLQLATSEYRAALKLDPDNSYVEERLTEAMGNPAAAKLQ